LRSAAEVLLCVANLHLQRADVGVQAGQLGDADINVSLQLRVELFVGEITLKAVRLARYHRRRQGGIGDCPLVGERGGAQLKLRECDFKLVHRRLFAKECHDVLQGTLKQRDLRRRSAFQPTHSRAVFGSGDPFFYVFGIVERNVEDLAFTR